MEEIHQGPKYGDSKPMRSIFRAIFFLFCARPVLAGDAANLKVWGYSKDAKYIAFEQYGVHDGSAFPYSEIFIIDVAKNEYAGKPFKAVNDAGEGEDDAGLKRIREKNFSDASKAFQQLGIDTSYVPLHELYSRLARNEMMPEDSLVLVKSANPFDIKITSVEIENPVCPDIPPRLLDLQLIQNGRARSLQKDTGLPPSRVCAFQYIIQAVFLKQNSLAVFIQFLSPGFEGPNARFICVTAKIN